MSDDKNTPPAENGQPQAANGHEQPETAGAKHHDDLIADLRRENSDLKDRALRAQAEVENMRKRTEREKEDTAKYANTRFARDMLTVGDNFQRALSAVPPGAADADPALKSLVDGVMITEREFITVLERNGVKRIDAQSQPFNPHLHQAVMEVPKPDVPAGTVVQVLQAGYVIDDRTLRPAMVAVSTGGPKAGKPQPVAETTPDASADKGNAAGTPPPGEPSQA